MVKSKGGAKKAQKSGDELRRITGVLIVLVVLMSIAFAWMIVLSIVKENRISKKVREANENVPAVQVEDDDDTVE